MKNPTEPNLKTEGFAVFILVLSFISAYYFRVIDLYFFPFLLVYVYLMFLLFPYFRINHLESAALKEDWHQAKDLSLSVLFTIQIVGLLILTGSSSTLLWALPILMFLLITTIVIRISKVLKYRRQ
jgi:hypothetical protein